MPTEIEELKKLVEDTRLELHEVHRTVEKIRKKMLWASVYEFIKFLVIFGPLIYGLWYFQPQLQQLMKSWEQVMQLMNARTSAPTADQNDPTMEKLRQEYPQLFTQ